MKKVIKLALVGMIVLAARKKTETVPVAPQSAKTIPAIQQPTEKVSAAPQSYTAKILKKPDHERLLCFKRKQYYPRIYQKSIHGNDQQSQ